MSSSSLSHLYTMGGNKFSINWFRLHYYYSCVVDLHFMVPYLWSAVHLVEFLAIVKGNYKMLSVVL